MLERLAAFAATECRDVNGAAERAADLSPRALRLPDRGDDDRRDDSASNDSASGDTADQRRG